MDTGGWSAADGKWHCYYGEDEPLGPGKFMDDRVQTAFEYAYANARIMSNVKPFTVRLHFHGDLDFFLGSRRSGGVIERALMEKNIGKRCDRIMRVPHRKLI